MDHKADFFSFAQKCFNDFVTLSDSLLLCTELTTKIDSIVTIVFHDVQNELHHKRSGGTKENVVSEGLVLLALGSYGRHEMTFDSDIDIGILIDDKDKNNIELNQEITTELIIRLKQIFPQELSSQCFYTSDVWTEKLKETEHTYTLFTFLEGRVLNGDGVLYLRERANILPQLPLLHMAREFLSNSTLDLPELDLENIDGKSCCGGILHLLNILRMKYILEFCEGCSNKNIDKVIEGFSSQDCTGKSIWFGVEKFCTEGGFQSQEHNDDIMNRESSEEDSSSVIFSATSIRVIHEAMKVFFHLRNYTGLVKRFSDSFNSQVFLSEYYKVRAESYPSAKELGRVLMNYSHNVGVLLSEARNQLFIKNWLYTDNGLSFLVEPSRKQVMSIPELCSVSLEHQKSESISSKRALDVLQILLSAFNFLAKKKFVLSSELKNQFAENISVIDSQCYFGDLSLVGSKIKQLFISHHTSTAISEMMRVNYVPSSGSRLKNLAGYFFPPFNTAPFFQTDPEFHEFDLADHSLKVLSFLEQSIQNRLAKQPDFSELMSDEDLFALKWSALFHDMGKTMEGEAHEITSNRISDKILIKLGLTDNSVTTEKIAYLIANHQRPEEIMRLALNREDAMMGLISLMENSPDRLSHLILLCAADIRGVNSSLNSHALRLEKIYEECNNLIANTGMISNGDDLRVHAVEQTNKELRKRADNALFIYYYFEFLENGIPDSFIQVVAEYHKIDIEAATRKIQPINKIFSDHSFMQNSLKDLELNKYKFAQFIRRYIPLNQAKEQNPELDIWLSTIFTVFPNRFLLSTPLGVLYDLARLFYNFNQNTKFEVISESSTENCRVLLCVKDDPNAIIKLSYLLNFIGEISIETGKINTIHLQDRTKIYCGYLELEKEPTAESLRRLKDALLEPISKEWGEVSVTNLSQSSLNSASVDYMEEYKAGYVVIEQDDEQFSRVSENYVCIKVTMPNRKYALFDILNQFKKVSITPIQIIITTYGDKIYDYFVFNVSDSHKIKHSNIKQKIKEISQY